MTGASLSRREREALCDLALIVGSTAPTLCSGWTAHDLLVHLVVRERRPWVRALSAVPPLSARAQAAERAVAKRPLPELVAWLRSTPLPVRLVDRAFNTLEYFVHHEDLRRAQPTWGRRVLSDADEAALWRQASLVGRMLVRPAGVPVVISSGSRRAVLRKGGSPVVVSGPVSEIVLFLFGRSAVEGLTFDGPPAAVAQLQAAKLGI